MCGYLRGMGALTVEAASEFYSSIDAGRPAAGDVGVKERLALFEEWLRGILPVIVAAVNQRLAAIPTALEIARVQHTMHSSASKLDPGAADELSPLSVLFKSHGAGELVSYASADLDKACEVLLSHTSRISRKTAAAAVGGLSDAFSRQVWAVFFQDAFHKQVR